MSRQRSLIALAVVVSVAATAACSARPRQRPIRTTPIDSGPQSLQEARKFLEGRWSLLSFEVFPPGAQPIALKGSGTLTYDAFGNLTMEIRADQAATDLLNRAGITMREGVISSEGRTVIDLQGKKLTYVIEGQPPGASSGPLAMSRPRYWQVDGDVLTLTTRDDSGNTLSTGKWKKQP